MQRQVQATGIDRFKSRLHNASGQPASGKAVASVTKPIEGGTRTHSNDHRSPAVLDVAKTQKKDEKAALSSNFMKRMAKKKNILGKMHEDEETTAPGTEKQASAEGLNEEDKEPSMAEVHTGCTAAFAMEETFRKIQAKLESADKKNITGIQSIRLPEDKENEQEKEKY